MNPQGSAAGNRLNMGWFLDSDGIPIGKTRTRPAAGTSTNGGPVLFGMPKSVTPTTSPASSPTLLTGEDGLVQHRYLFPADNTQVTTITLSAEDLITAGLVQNMPVRPLAGARYLGLGENINPPDMALLFQSWSIRMSDGAKLWRATYYPRASITYRGRDGFNERGVATFQYDFVANPVQYESWGVTVFDADGVQAQQDKLEWDELTAPLCVQAFTGSGAVAAFPLDFKPYDEDSVAAFLASPTLGIRGAVEASILSVSLTHPYTVTLTSNPGNGYRGLFVYQRAA